MKVMTNGHTSRVYVSLRDGSEMEDEATGKSSVEAFMNAIKMAEIDY